MSGTDRVRRQHAFKVLYFNERSCGITDTPFTNDRELGIEDKVLARTCKPRARRTPESTWVACVAGRHRVGDGYR
jgi:hypothetical protein